MRDISLRPPGGRLREKGQGRRKIRFGHGKYRINPEHSDCRPTRFLLGVSPVTSSIMVIEGGVLLSKFTLLYVTQRQSPALFTVEGREVGFFLMDQNPRRAKKEPPLSGRRPKVRLVSSGKRKKKRKRERRGKRGKPPGPLRLLFSHRNRESIRDRVVLGRTESPLSRFPSLLLSTCV